VLVPVVFTQEFRNVVRGPDDVGRWREVIERWSTH